MTSQKYFMPFVVALSVFAAIPRSAEAAILIQNQQTDFITAANRNEPLTKVVVGASDVAISGFGVYGQSQIAGNLKWIIFDANQPTSPVFLSPAQAVAANPGAFADHAQWFDLTSISFTLLAGHTYAMGLISDQFGTNGFRWGASPDNLSGPYPTIAANGLSLPFMQSLDNSGVIGGTFTNTPNILLIDRTNRRQMDLRIFGPDSGGSVPEPASLILWSVLGLIGLAFMARKGRKLK
jgi:hypothetical protein